jgi:hypothetical protein
MFLRLSKFCHPYFHWYFYQKLCVPNEEFPFRSPPCLMGEIPKHQNAPMGMPSCRLWQYRLWSFQTGDTKLERFYPKNQHTQRKWLNFEFWINGELSKSAKIWLSKSTFYVKNHPNLSHFFHIKEYQFRSTLFVIGIFW